MITLQRAPTPQTIGINLTDFLPFVVTFMATMLIINVVMKVAIPPDHRHLPPVETPPGYYPRVVSEEREALELEKREFEGMGRIIASQAGKGVVFICLESGWEKRLFNVEFVFNDKEGHEIVARSLDELKRELKRRGQ